MAKKYISLSKLSKFLDNLKETFAPLFHKHTISDITDFTIDKELSSTSTNPVQNKVINDELEAISEAFAVYESALDDKADESHNHIISDVTNLQSVLDGKVPTTRTINGKALSSNITLSAPDVGADASGSASAVQTNLDVVSDKLDGHVDNATIHTTSSEKTKWNTAYTHSQASHARTDATKVAKSTTNGNILINGTETTVYTHPSGTNPHGTTKSDVGLGNVDNTSDANKPVSTAQKAAIDAVQDNVDTVQDELTEHIDNDDIHFTADERTKLSGIATGANKYTHPSSGVTAGTYKSVTVDAQGHVTAGTNPTTLAGYGITDADSKGAADTALTTAKSYTDTKISNLINGAPTTLDTLGEIASAMEENADVVEALEEAIGTKANASDLTAHTGNTSNPHSVTKSQVGLGNVENKSSATIRGELTKTNVTTALGYTPYTQTEIDDLLAKKVDAVSGKGLSTNDYTTTEKTKLSGIATGAEVNQNAFSNIKVGDTTVAADAKTDTLTLAGSNVTITPDATNDKITIAVADGSTSTKGILQLTNSTSSTSTTTAATPASVKSAYDLANTAKTNAATAQTKADSAYTLAESKADSLSDLGVTATATELNYVDGVTSNIQTQLDGKAASSHGNHVPTTETANNAKFLRNDNTWQTVTPANIGAATTSHGTHVSYSTTAPVMDGTASAGSASTVARSDHKHPTDTSRASASDLTSEISRAKAAETTLQTNIDKKSNSGHTHNYAGSSSAGGSANSAVKLATARTINNVSFDGTKNITVTANPNTTQLTGVDLNNYMTPGFYNGGGDNGCTNVPSGVDAFGMIVFKNAGGYICQLLVGGNINTNIMYLRTYTGSWTDWETQYSTANKPTPADIGAAASSHIHKVANISDLTATATELNYMDGVTSNVQTQLNGKASSAAATTSANGLMTSAMVTKLNGIAEGANKYSLPTASSSTLGGVKTTSTVTSNSGYTACPIISGVPYYKDTNTTYSLGSFGITATSAELNYCDGVTSNIQTQLNGKAASSHGTHVTYGTTTPLVAGTGAVGTSSGLARIDHVHPAQTTVSGNAGTATKLATSRTIDGVSFNGSTAITHYGTCSTAAATVAKTVALTGFTLATGARVLVKFTVTNTAASPTLNVNSTGAKAIMYRGSAIAAGYLAANRVYEFVYDGTDWEVVGDIDTNTTYTLSSITGTLTVAKGGTGVNTLKSGQVLVGNGTGAVTTRAIDTTAGGTSGSTSLITSGAVYSGLSNMISDDVTSADIAAIVV